MTAAHLITLIVLLVLLVVTPGPGMVTILATVGGAGLRAGVILISGIASIHLLYAAVVLWSFGLVFDRIASWVGVITLIAGGYLFYLGVRQYRMGHIRLSAAEKTISDWQQFAAGLISAVTNPKIIVFYVTILPSTLDFSTMSWLKAAQILAVIAGVIWGMLVGVCIMSGIIKQIFIKPQHERRVNHIAGVLLMGVGMSLIVSLAL